MALYAPIKIKHTPVVTASPVVTNYIGAQTVAGQRGTLPTFNDGNSYSVSKAGSDANAGTIAAPFLTIGKVFASAAAGKLGDYSGSGYTLTQAGTVTHSAWPCYPIPTSGDYYAGPFTDSDYFTAPAGLRTVLTGLTAYTISMAVYIQKFSVVNMDLVDIRDGAANVLSIISDGSVQFNLNGTVTTSATGLVVPGKWYYIAMVVDPTKVGTSTSKQVFLGETPETAVSVIATNQTHTLGTVSSVTIGKSQGTGGRYVDGFISRLFFENSAKFVFPTNLYSTGTTVTTGILGAYYFQTLPLVVTAPLSYLVVNDSGVYNENIRCNYNYESATTTTLGIYAKDGFAPTIAMIRGAIPGTYGANNASRVLPLVAPSHYVSKSGSDSNAGTSPAVPFLTIQKALNTILPAPLVVQVMDSGAYTEVLTTTKVTTIQAAPSVAPTLKSTYPGLSVFYGSSNLIVSGCILDGQTTGTIQAGNAAVSYLDCSFLGGRYIVGSSGQAELINCLVRQVTSLAISGVTPTNCYFDYQKNGITNFAMTFGQPYMMATQCTFNFMDITYTNNAAISYFKKCLFNNSTLTTGSSTAASSVGFGLTSLLYNKFVNGSLSFAQSQNASIGRNLVYGNIIQANGQTTGLKFVRTGTPTLFSNGVYHNCVMGAQTNYLLSGTQDSTVLINNTSVGALTIALDSPAITACNAFLDSGSALIGGLPYRGGITPNGEVGSVLGQASRAENVTLSGSDAGIFGASVTDDIGQDYGIMEFKFTNITINGFNVTGIKNGAGGINPIGKASGMTVSFCTFSGLGTYAVKLSDGGGVNNCLFQSVNGHAIKSRKSGAVLLMNIVANAAGAAFLNYGGGVTNAMMTAYGCQYGEYDSAGSFGIISNCIFSGSGAYDYSGGNLPNYSCIGTIDPAGITQTLGTGCIRLDPLFVSPATGDLSLQSIMRGYYFDSPAKGTGVGGIDMGAWSWIYGVSTTSWTTLDFSTTGYRNPDQIMRKELSIKLAEGDREDGSIYSISAVYKKEYEMTWNPKLNDMVRAQVTNLLAMFTSATNSIQIDFGDGRGYIAAYFGRQSGFEYADMTGYYSNDATPTPIRTLTIREA